MGFGSHLGNGTGHAFAGTTSHCAGAVPRGCLAVETLSGNPLSGVTVHIHIAESDGFLDGKVVNFDDATNHPMEIPINGGRPF